MFLLILAIFTLLVAVVIAVDAAVGLRTVVVLPTLTDNAPVGVTLPTVSIVIAARNEEKNIEEALRSVLALDYPSREIILVNDRSTDRTGAILAAMSAKIPALTIVTLTELPDGWLGKNYAQWRGAQAARGELILFTDADVVFHPSVLRRAIPYFVHHGLDHLAIAPTVVTPSVPLRYFMPSFVMFFNAFFRPWKVRDPKSSNHVGIGAFNMVRRSAYVTAGTHERIRMRPDDDVKLGKIMKQSGFRQDFMLGGELLSVEWYDSLKGLIDGLMKNSFSAVEYHFPLVILGCAAQFILFLWPWVALFMTRGTVWGVYAGTGAILLLSAMDQTRLQRQPARYGFALPFAMSLLIYIALKASIKTIFNNGIDWRGTRYPLSELRRNKV